MSEIQKAIELKQELDALRPLSADDEQRIMQKFRLDWNYHSNHLEGNTLTYGETKALILFGLTAQGKPLKDHIEIEGHNEAVQWIIEVVKEQRPLTENFIRQLHKLILKENYFVDAITPDGQPTRKEIKVGQYKSTPNHVKTKTGEIFRFATPEETPAKMEELMDWYKAESEKEEVNPILLAAEFHYRFVRIHPFDDGNGRTARLLMNFILMRHGYPPVIIKTEDKVNYFGVLRLADAGQIGAFVEYIASNLTYSLDLMIRGAKGESVEEEGDLLKEVAILKNRFNNLDNRVEEHFQSEIEKKKYTFLSNFTMIVNQYSALLSNVESLYTNFYYKFLFDGKEIRLKREKFFENGSSKVNIHPTLSEISETIDRKTKDVRFQIDLISKGKSGITSFSYKEEFVLQYLDDSKYKVIADKRSVERYVGTQLKTEEIDDLLGNAFKVHVDFLKKKFDELDRKVDGL